MANYILKEITQGVGSEEMPDPRHKFCWIGWGISPCATIAISLPSMMHDYQHRQTDLQINFVLLA